MDLVVAEQGGYFHAGITTALRLISFLTPKPVNRIMVGHSAIFYLFLFYYFHTSDTEYFPSELFE